MRRYILKEKKLLLLSTILTIMVAVCNTSMALIMKELVDVGTIKNLSKFKILICITALVIIVLLLSEYFKKVVNNTLIKKWSIALKDDVFEELLKRNPKVFNSGSSGKYISILTNDVDMIKESYFSSIISLMQTVIQIIIGGYAIFKLDVIIGIAIVVLSILPLFIPKITEKYLSQKKDFQSEKLSKFTSNIKDIFQGFNVIKSFNIYDKINKQFKRANYESEEAELKFSNYNSLVNILTALCSYLMILISLAIGTYLVIKGKATAGILIASIQLMDIISMAVLDFTYEVIDLKSVKLINKKIIEIVEEDTPSEEGIEKLDFNKEIKFEDVSFAYEEDREVLKNINFSMKKGEKYAIVGQSGSGKSTLLSLLLRYYTEYKGNIYVDGVEVRELKLSNVSKLISAIHQDIFIFDSDIKDNICLFNFYEEEDIRKAIELSGLDKTINSLGLGINSQVGENGDNLSGGEKQRIAIARALIRETPILFLDEATSSLDKEISYKIESSILNLEDITSIVITHKLNESLLSRYDKIIVMKDGEIEEIGSFNELINNKAYFYNLFNIEAQAVLK
ncbi:ATP-binding cassette, subfamily C [Clostridium collagenovorans DSM 3089]|uniref:ATP-binding cassette, subfamily C n=1 Tax=Clostridium collagenovorans DSM 3089 TaxID=1121306 RepID=A0A1M5WRC2_9CLOT|nr:ABC transporter ATP-binding protein [Clostridium collagenovorans]SHH90107.1 ATP-binding cassette, subfamily C [Clostridium collagenovorans DSM 3089]